MNTDISSSTTILERLREQIDLSRQEAENNEKRSATAVRKLSKSKEIYKSVEYAIDNFLNYAPPAGTCKISPADSNELEELLPSVILKLHCMDMRDLRKAYNENNNRINELQKKYEARYTTKANNANLIKFAKTVFFPSREKGSFFLAVSCQGIPATPSWAVARLQIFLKTIFCCQDASAKGHPCALRFSQDSAHRLRTDFVNPRPHPLSIFLDRVAICLIECGSQQHTFRRGRRPLRPSVETGKRQLWPRRSAATTNLLCPPFFFFGSQRSTFGKRSPLKSMHTKKNPDRQTAPLGDQSICRIPNGSVPSPIPWSDLCRDSGPRNGSQPSSGSSLPCSGVQL